MISVEQIKIYGLREISSTNCLKQISSNQEIFDITKYFQFDNSYVFAKVILHECQRSCKIEYFGSSFVHSISEDAVYCIDCAMFLSVEKQ